MSFPRYPKYKDSGVEWLAEVPEHWECTALKRLVDSRRPITYGIVQAGPNIIEGVPYIRPADMMDEKGVVSSERLLRTSKDIAEAYMRSTIQPGDIVCSIGPSFGKVMITPQCLAGANLTQGTARVAVRPDQCARYVFWALRSDASVAQWESRVGGATFRALNLGPLAETAIPIPSLREQTAIAAFLDRETAKIDALIAEQQRLIELLQEKRQAVISHAVTKGLNPDAPMKDSGIEWLGEVPEHWEVVRLKHLIETGTSISYGIVQPGDPLDGGVPFVQTTNMTSGDFALKLLQRTSTEIASQYPRSTLKGGEVLLGIRASIGAAHVVPNSLAGANLSRGVARIVPNIKIESSFLVAALRSDVTFTYWGLSQQGSTFNEVSIATVKELSIAVPPRDEQHEITKFVRVESERLDSLIAEAEQAITLLQERRSALISAAVTGQIDVRGLAGSEAA